MRTVHDLIAELEQEATNFYIVALALGFDDHAEFIFNTDQQKEWKLAESMARGGEPVGLMCMQKEGKVLRVQCRVLEEYIDDPEVAKYVDSLGRDFMQLAQSCGAA